ncbi:hypothetical protein B0H14DRAFT_3039426, partial [Mycena olivaceomarginata]
MRKLKPAYFLAYVDYWPCSSVPALWCLWVLMGADVPSWPWYLDAADAAHHGLVREMDRAARAGTAEDAFVVCPNRTSTRAGGMPWSTGRYKGADRIARPGALKRQWDSQEFFVNKRNPLCEKRLRRDSCPLLSPAPSHNN